MTARRFTEGLGVAVVATAFLAAAVQVQAVRERTYPPVDLDVQAVYVTSGNAVRRLAGAFNSLAADAYWIRAIQYYGGAKRRLAEGPALPEPPPMLAAVESGEYEQLFTLLDITTTLDPLFEIAYRFGAVFLAEAYPAGAGRADLAVKLLEKGLAHQPDRWEYMQDIGFVYYWYEHDYREASAWFAKASEVPHAPVWLQGLAATTLAQGGDRESSRTMWQSIYQSSEVDWMRATAERVLTQLNVMDQIDEIQVKVDELARAIGTPPSDWQTVVRAGVFPGIPLDPTNTPYELTPDGRVRLSQSSGLFPLPVEPSRINPLR